MPPKRKAGGPKGKNKQPKQDGQKAVSHDIEIPIDEGFDAASKPNIDASLVPSHFNLQAIAKSTLAMMVLSTMPL